MIRSTSIAASIALGLLVQPVSANTADHFSSSLAGLPATVFTGMASAMFVNLQAIAEISAKQGIALKATQRGSLGMEWPIYQVLAMATPEALQDSTGLRFEQFQFLTVMGARPTQTLVWGVAPEARAPLRAHLPQAGFSAYGSAAHSWSNGPLGLMNLDVHHTPNPWRWPMGEASLVSLTDSLLYQSQSEAAMQAALQQPSALDSAAGQALVGSYGQTLITQAILFSAELGQTANGSATNGQPPYLGAMLADIEGQDGARGVLAFAYADCAQAEQARDVLQTQWQAQTPAVPVFAIAKSQAACLATVTLKDPQPTAAGNQGFFALFSAFMMRQLPPLAAQ